MKKLIDKIVMGTKVYQKLKFECDSVLETIKKISEEKHKIEAIISRNKTIARKISRVINAFKKENNVDAIKEIKALCNEIIKGE